MAVAYDFIASNKRKTWLIALLFPLSFSLLVYLCLLGIYYFTYEPPRVAKYGASTVAMNEYGGMLAQVNEVATYVLPVTMGVALIWIVISYFAGGSMLLRNAHAKEISKQDNPELYRLVENLCISKGLPIPKIYIMDDSSLNAFATGRNPKNSSIAVTSGLLQYLNRAEVEGVIAHELAHVENRDITIMLIGIAGISFFTIVGELLFRSAGRVRGGKNSGQAQLFLFIMGVVFIVFGYFIAPLLRLAMSRQREYLADATAALTTRNPGALASALEKISGNSRVEILDEHPSMAAMCIESPQEAESSFFNRLSGLYATHPPITERIKRLREMDGQSI